MPFSLKYYINLIFLYFVVTGCTSTSPSNKEAAKSHEIINNELKVLIESSNVEGCVLIYDESNNTFYSNSFSQAEHSILPASTFKIANTIVGLETGIIDNEKFIFEWDGNERGMKIWEEDLNLQQAFQRSCVPCYQELAREIGEKKMNSYLQKIGYPGMNVKEENIDLFWLVGSSNINAFEQIEFLRRLNNEQIPISDTSLQIIKNIMIFEENETYTLRGKTGLAIRDRKDKGWFVGWLEKENSNIYFATRLSPRDSIMSRSDFIPLRKNITLESLKSLGHI